MVDYPYGQAAADLITALIPYGFYPMVSLPTGVTKSSSTLIDKIILNDGHLLHLGKVSVLLDALSDHRPVYLEIDTGNSNAEISQSQFRTAQHYVLTPENKVNLVQLLDSKNRAPMLKKHSTHSITNSSTI